MSEFTQEQINHIRKIIKEEIRQELLDNLKISINSHPTSDYYSRGTNVEVVLTLEGDIIDKADYYIEDKNFNPY